MGYIILLHGSLGSGKPTCASYIAKELGAQRIQLDEVLTSYGLDDERENQGCISAGNFMKGIDRILDQMRAWWEQGEVIVVDGCFYHEQVLQYLLEQVDCEVYVYTLVVSLDLCIERDAHRAVPLGEQAARAVYGLVSSLRFGRIIDGSGSVEETVDAIRCSLPT